jgi:hypothetical protein
MAETTPTEAAQPDEPRRRVAEVARREAAPAARRAPRVRDETVFVWPSLLVIEFLAALLMLLTLMIVSWLVNAPLEAHANPDRTPNPSKAPWYFLNLQELLLHMHPALAGVLVPTGALIALAALPYIDRDTSDVGKWIPQRNAGPIIIFSAIYTTVVLLAMLLIDERPGCGACGLKQLTQFIANTTGIEALNNVLISGWILPTIIMLAPVVLLVIILRKVWQASVREVAMGLFTGFVVTYVILTVTGTVFRGPNMWLYWPWDMPPRTE